MFYAFWLPYEGTELCKVARQSLRTEGPQKTPLQKIDISLWIDRTRPDIWQNGALK